MENTMEPNLEDIDDYKKPLKKSKKKMIILFFMALLIIYAVVALVQSNIWFLLNFKGIYTKRLLISCHIYCT